ncbi:MAG: RsmE family RNA methyltransferase, partial [Spirochaetes bacterium]|nr:RsmE family RNA methyltransferase [Spirochaetota bacterium]
FFSLLKGDKNELILKRCTEIGVDCFIPVETKNSIVSYTEQKFQNKKKRWHQIIREAAMQCGRQNLPELIDKISFHDLVNYDKISTIKLYAWFNGEKSLKKILKSENNDHHIAIIVGPEGDFTAAEVDFLKQHHWQGINLSDNVLRSETAAYYFTSIVSFLLSGRDE